MTQQYVRIATRKSNMALVQTRFVANLIQQHHPHLEPIIIPYSTQGDDIQDKPLADIGGKALFVNNLERKLQANEADIAVHSLKDVPSILADDFELACFLERQSPFDALISPGYSSFAQLPAGATIGTCSPRRQSLLSHQRPDLIFKPLRGNAGTRLAKLARGEYDAIILAESGLNRLQLSRYITQVLPTDICLPAVGQGILAIEIRAGEDRWRQLLTPINHGPTMQAAQAERAFCARLGGNCHSPIAALAQIDSNHNITMQTMVGSPKGEVILQHQGQGTDANTVGINCALSLLAQGAANYI